MLNNSNEPLAIASIVGLLETLRCCVIVSKLREELWKNLPS